MIGRNTRLLFIQQKHLLIQLVFVGFVGSLVTCINGHYLSFSFAGLEEDSDVYFALIPTDKLETQ